MKITPDKELFWFLKEGASLELSDPSVLEMYIQQVISRGRMEDIKSLLRRVSFDQLKHSFSHINRFLPLEVRKFWEDYIENY